MDLNTVEAFLAPADLADLPPWRPGDAWLGGGTWLFSEPQPAVTRLVDLTALRWRPIVVDDRTVSLAATCTIAELGRAEWPGDWRAAPLVGQCCRALLGSFKIWNRATVGGNLCLALPAGPMIALAVALDGVCVVRASDGGERRVAVRDFVQGPRETALAPDEILTRVDLPVAAFRRRTSFRQVSLSPAGRSGALVIGTRAPAGAFALTVTASTPRPVHLAWDAAPDAAVLHAAIEEAAGAVGWFDDVHGAPDWRRHVTHVLSGEVRRELGE